MKTSTQLLLFLLLSFLSLSVSVDSLCRQTHDSKVCMSTTNRLAKTSSSGTLSAHLSAINNQLELAKKEALQLKGRVDPGTAAALKNCENLYNNALDMIGVSTRAISANDGQTQQMVQVMVQNILYSVQQCGMQFTHRPNPMYRFDDSIIKMTMNCNNLNKMS